MKISIVLPVYNVENYLKRCLDSIMNQDIGVSYEVICINDGSTDNSKDILDLYQTKYSNIRVINQENKGLSYSRNRGILESNGKYIIFIDSDDYLLDMDCIQTMYNECELNNLDFIFADFKYTFDDNTKDFDIKRDSNFVNKIMSGKEFYDIGIKTKSIMSVVWNKLYKKDFIVKNNLFFIEDIYYEDMDFTPKVFFLAERVKHLDNVIYAYVQRAGSITNSKQRKVRINDYLKILHSLYKFNTIYNDKNIKLSYDYIIKKIFDELFYIRNTDELNLYYKKLQEDDLFINIMKSSYIKYRLYAFCLYLYFSLKIKLKIKNIY